MNRLIKLIYHVLLVVLLQGVEQSTAQPITLNSLPAKQQIHALLRKKYIYLCAVAKEKPVSIAYFQEELYHLNPTYTMDFLLALDSPELTKRASESFVAPSCHYIVNFSSVHLPGYIVCEVVFNKPTHAIYSADIYLFQVKAGKVSFVSKKELQYD